MDAWSLVGRVSAAKKLAFIATGYALSVGGGLAAVAINELLVPADIAQTSPGMVAFGDVILFLLVAGFLSLAPTWFLLKLGIEKTPRALLATASAGRRQSRGMRGGFSCAQAVSWWHWWQQIASDCTPFSRMLTRVICFDRFGGARHRRSAPSLN